MHWMTIVNRNIVKCLCDSLYVTRHQWQSNNECISTPNLLSILWTLISVTLRSISTARIQKNSMAAAWTRACCVELSSVHTPYVAIRRCPVTYVNVIFEPMYFNGSIQTANGDVRQRTSLPFYSNRVRIERQNDGRILPDGNVHCRMSPDCHWPMELQSRFMNINDISTATISENVHLHVSPTYVAVQQRTLRYVIVQ